MLYTFLSDIIPLKIILLAGVICAPVLCALLLKLFANKLPKDQGREFAVDGNKSVGKIRGAGIVFICSFIICSLIFVPLSIEYGIYYVLLFLGMLTGYLDDRSEKPWNEYKKGALDLLISIGTAVTFVYYNSRLLRIGFHGHNLTINPVVFAVIGTILVWMLINAVNCSDGIDGYSSTLCIISYLSLAAILYFTSYHSSRRMLFLVMLLILTLLPYLWKNAEPSTMMMGDAGSRALGLFMAILVMKTGNFLLVIPLCFMLCLDGLLGIIKVSIIRFLHIKVMQNIRTPLHDHCRKNKGWSNTQVIYRFSMIQVVISALAILGAIMFGI